MSEAAMILERARHLAEQGRKDPLLCLTEVAQVIGSKAHTRALLLVDAIARESGASSIVSWTHGATHTHEQVLELFDEAIFRAELEGS